MNKIFRFTMIVFFLCLAVTSFAWGKKEVKPETAEKGTLIQVSGRVRLVGNDPFPEIVITAQQGEWYVDKEDEHKFKELQHKTVTVEGLETVKKLTFANGMPAGERRMLKSVKIISVE